MNKIENIINKIKKYIEEKYNIKTELKDFYESKNNIYINAEKYDLNIGVAVTDKKHYLYGKCNYYLIFDYETNKKYRNELNWHGGGFHDKYVPNDYTNIDEFLKKFIGKKQSQKQMTIFDFLPKEQFESVEHKVC